MGHAKLLRIGGYVSGGVLIVFGVIVIALVVGVALLLTGIGLVILAIAVFGRSRPAELTASTPAPAAV